MPKLERLIELARLKRGGVAMTVRELGVACGVSERTVYRYLNTLSDIDIKKVLKQPPAGSLKSRLSQLALTQDDQVLIEYALQQSDLAAYPCLAKRFRKVCRCLALAVEQAGPANDVCMIEPSATGRIRKRDFKGAVVDKFLRAGRLGIKLRIVPKRKPRKEAVLSPNRLVLHDGKLLLSFIDPEKGKTLSLPPEHIRTMTVARS